MKNINQTGCTDCDLLRTIADLKRENEKLADTVNWMHDTIWKQLQLIQAYQQDSKIPVGKS